MKYLKIFEEFERGVYTKISPKTLQRGNDYIKDVYPFLNIDLSEYIDYIDVIPGGNFLYNDIEYDSIESLIESVHENALSIWDYRRHKYTINNGLIDVSGHVNISHIEITKIPYKFGEVTGSFGCDDNKLTNLKGAPHTVGGSFWCGHNRLTSLEGAPHTVGGDFSCRHNQITTLEGAPHTVGGYFDIKYNKLTNLKYLPEEIGGQIYCGNNPNLTDFSDVPEEWESKIKVTE